MRFGVLGPLAVWTDDGEPVTIPGTKVRMLLADLLVNQGRPVSTDRLADDLWGERAPANPTGAIQVRVSQLRKALDDAEPGSRELVVSQPAGYALASRSVDAIEFDGLASRAGETPDPRTRVGLLNQALALWRGPAFADVRDEEFARPAILRLEDQRLAILEQRAEARLELGEHSLLAGELAELVVEHPLRERLHAAYLRALYGAGRATEALDQYAQLRHRLAEELGLDPSPELVELQRAILDQEAGLERRRRSNLPAAMTVLIGRDEAIAEVSACLSEQRLVTLTGPGGVGKTSLALVVARAASYPEGAWLIELGALERDGTAELTLSTLDVRDGQGSAVDRLTEVLDGRELLLVFDNCEHVIDDAAATIEAVLRNAPRVTVLATSREPLGLPGETVWAVAPLPEPSAVDLFVARAQAADRDFRLDEQTTPAVELLCRRLDGIPLALELAATRIRALGVAGLVERLDDRFRLLAGGHRGAPPRQQTLFAMIDWSWSLLGPSEQAVLARLAVHTDGCTLVAAEATCAGDGVERAEVLEILARLVDRSLVRYGGDRYRLLESVAAYCLDRLAELDPQHLARRRHDEYYLALAEQAERHLRGPEQQHWLRTLDSEAANLRSTLDSSPAVALRLAIALTWYWFLRGRWHEARRSLTAALEKPDRDETGGDETGGDETGRDELRPLAAAWTAGLAALRGEALDVTPLDQIEDPIARARAIAFLGYASLDAGDLTTSEKLLDRALAGAAEYRDDWVTALALVTRAKLAHIRGDTAALGRDASRSAELFQRIGDDWGVLQATEWLAALAEMTGDYPHATELNRSGHRLAEELGLWSDAATRLGWLGWLALQTGEPATAREHGTAALRLAQEQGNVATAGLAEIVLAFAARRLGEPEVAQRLLDGLRERAAGLADPVFLPLVLTELGFLAEQRGDPATALAHHGAAIASARSMGAGRDVLFSLEGAAGALGQLGRYDDAVRLLAVAEAERVGTGLPATGVERVERDRIAAGLPSTAVDRELSLVEACLLVERAGSDHSARPTRTG